MTSGTGAIIMRHIHLWKNDWTRLVNALYWPLLEILCMGDAALWLSSSPKVAHSVLAAAMLWQIAIRANYEMVVILFEEIWSHNITNLFASPITIWQWLRASVVLSFIFTVVSHIFCGIIAYVTYDFNILALGWIGWVLAINLWLSGLFLGFLSMACIILYGDRITMLAYMIGWFFVPFSGVYFSIDVLPNWMQIVARCFPMSYIFDVLHGFIIEDKLLLSSLGIATGLNLLYLLVGVGLFRAAFEKSHDRGLEQLLR